MSAVTISAPAKFNLYLGVTGRAENGYHTVETVMQALTLCDIVTVSSGISPDEPIRITCTEPNVPCDENNLAYRAAELFFSQTGTRFPVSIHIEKHIPVAGGLAGGSTDAAAVLCALNRISAQPLSQQTLLTLAASLGADVPFCLLSCLGTPAALGVHFGETVSPCPPLAPMHVLVVSAGEHVSTPWAYKTLDRRGKDDAENGCMPLLHALEKQDTQTVLSLMYNAFEPEILPFCPHASENRRLLVKSGADRVMMSGSGPTIIGLYRDKNRAMTASEVLIAAGAHVCLCRTK